MSAERNISRRTFASGLALLGLSKPVLAQGSAGLGTQADGYARVTPGKTFTFPANHGPHPDFRIEWWYVTANLTDPGGAAYGANGRCFAKRWRRVHSRKAGPTSRSG